MINKDIINRLKVIEEEEQLDKYTTVLKASIELKETLKNKISSLPKNKVYLNDVTHEGYSKENNELYINYINDYNTIHSIIITIYDSKDSLIIKDYNILEDMLLKYKEVGF